MQQALSQVRQDEDKVKNVLCTAGGENGPTWASGREPEVIMGFGILPEDEMTHAEEAPLSKKLPEK